MDGMVGSLKYNINKRPCNHIQLLQRQCIDFLCGPEFIFECQYIKLIADNRSLVFDKMLVQDKSFSVYCDLFTLRGAFSKFHLVEFYNISFI